MAGSLAKVCHQPVKRVLYPLLSMGKQGPRLTLVFSLGTVWWTSFTREFVSGDHLEMHRHVVLDLCPQVEILLVDATPSRLVQMRKQRNRSDERKTGPPPRKGNCRSFKSPFCGVQLPKFGINNPLPSNWWFRLVVWRGFHLPSTRTRGSNPNPNHQA